MIIKIDKLINISNILLERFKKSEGNEIDLEHDFYWNIPDIELYNPYESPTDFILGQLDDDYLVLSKSLDEDCLISYD